MQPPSPSSINDHTAVPTAVAAAASSGAGLVLVPRAAQSWRDALQKAGSLRTTDDLQMLTQFCRQHESVNHKYAMQ